MSKNCAISIESLVKKYKSKNCSKTTVALNKVSFDLIEGEFFGLLGKNGAGKSTLINILSGASIKTEGKVKIFDYDIDSHRHEATKCIGIVNQEDGFFNFIKVRELLLNHMGYYGITPDIKKANKVLDIVSLKKNADQAIRSLSGGMRKRLMIAKALIIDPKIIILDEPTAGVDIENRNSLWKYITKINKELGVSVLLTTHYMEEAERYCDKIAIMSNGQIAKMGTKEEILSHDEKSIIIKISEKTTDQKDSLIKSLNNKSLSINVEALDNSSISIEYNESSSNLKTIFALLASSDIEILSIQSKEKTLEDVFLSVNNSAH